MWPAVEGACRHLWQQRSIKVIIKGCRIKRRQEKDVNAWVWGLGFSKGSRVNLLLLLYMIFYCILSSPYLCVFDDDHVTCYMGTDVDVSEHVDTQSQSGANMGVFTWKYFIWILWIIFVISTMNHFIFVRVKHISRFYRLMLIIKLLFSHILENVLNKCYLFILLLLISFK